MTAVNPLDAAPGSAAPSRWARLLSGEGGDVLDLQFGENDQIVAVTRLGLFRSDNRGERWLRIESPPLVQALHRAGGWWLGSDVGLFRADRLDSPWQPILSRVAVTGVSVDEQSDLLLAATLEEGLLRSDDGGTTWEDANPGLPGDDIVAIHLSPTFERDQTIFVATESGLFRSRNGGRAWRQVPFEPGDIQCFARIEDRLVLGTDGDGLLVSADAGRTWDRSRPGETIIGVGTSPGGNTIILGETGLFTLDPGGDILRRSTSPPNAFCAIATGGRMLVGTIGYGVLRRDADDRGWLNSSIGLEATLRSRVRITDNQGIVTTSGAGAILASADGGASWSELPDAPLAPVRDFDARLDANHGFEVLACDGQSAAVYRGHWRLFASESPVAVAWLGDDPTLLTEDGHFVCDTFRSRMLPRHVRLLGARLIPVRGRPHLLWSVLYTDSAGVVVLRSDDGGRQWEPLMQSNATGAVSLAVGIDASGGEVALVAVGNRVYRVLESPEPVWTGGDRIAISAMALGEDGSVLLGTSDGLFAASMDFSTSERIVGSPAPLLDVDADEAGGTIAIERGGTLWRFSRTGTS